MQDLSPMVVVPVAAARRSLRKLRGREAGAGARVRGRGGV